MSVRRYPRHIEEHAKHCPECYRRVWQCYGGVLCPEGEKMYSEWKIIAARIDKLPKLDPSQR